MASLEVKQVATACSIHMDSGRIAVLMDPIVDAVEKGLFHRYVIRYRQLLKAGLAEVISIEGSVEAAPIQSAGIEIVQPVLAEVETGC